MEHDFIGAGWAFPVGVDARGAIALARGREELEQAMRLILMTYPGERPMRPQFGCGIHELVFAPTDATTAGRVAYEVRLALRRWEPRIEVDDVEVTYEADRPGDLLVSITYTAKETYDRRNLVFPFYVIPEGGEY